MRCARIRPVAGSIAISPRNPVRADPPDPDADGPGVVFPTVGDDAGPGPECYGASITVDDKIPSDWVVVTRDLYADFGEFTWTGIALSPVDGEYALFDHIYLGRTTRDFELVKPKANVEKPRK